MTKTTTLARCKAPSWPVLPGTFSLDMAKSGCKRKEREKKEKNEGELRSWKDLLVFTGMEEPSSHKKGDE